MNTAASTVAVVDAGVGNLGNVRRAVERVAPALRVLVTDDPEVVRQSRCLILPGVGAFRPPRERLRGALGQALSEAVDQGAFLLGICVGYQLLFESSDEFGHTDGLGYLPGRVTELRDCSLAGAALPHIGWNRLIKCGEHPLVAGVHDDDAYFVHSYAAQEVPEELVVAACCHGSQFPAVVARGNVMGTQFHPEKSGPVGLRILANYFQLAGERHD